MTYRLPSLNSLRAFEAAARHLSFKTAATELGVTAGAISQQVKKLETSLGVELFRRLPHGLLLTQQGEIYLPKISRIFEDLTTATEKIAPKINSKKFVIGVCPKSKKYLPKNWPECNPELGSYIRETVTTDDVEQVRKDEIDCLIRTGAGPYGKLHSVCVTPPTSSKNGQQKMHLICKTGLSDCRQTLVILADLENRYPPG